MDNPTNTAHKQNPKTYTFYFAQQLNVSRQRKDSKSSSSASSQNKTPMKILKISDDDEIVQTDNCSNTHPQQSLLDGMEQNQFIQPFHSTKKNTCYSQFKDKSSVYSSAQKAMNNQTQIPNLQIENQNQNSFLLDSDTYKQICYEQNQKKIEIISNFSMKTFNQIQNLCQIHEKPFEIVCIQDKALICSHCAIFGEHKTHSLAPLKQIEKNIECKKNEINEIINDYKTFQLNIQQKSFINNYTEKIFSKKQETKSQVNCEFSKMKEFLIKYESQICNDLEKFYKELENKLYQSIKIISNETFTAVFEHWERDATHIIQQISAQQLSNQNKVKIFLSNFTVPKLISFQSPIKIQNIISTQTEGIRYLSEIKEELDLNIDNIMKILQKFSIKFDSSFEQKIQQSIHFECQKGMFDFSNKFSIIERRMKNQIEMQQSNSSIKNIKGTTKSIKFKLKQPELASTVVSLSQSQQLPFSLQSPKKNNNLLSKKSLGNLGQSKSLQPNLTTIKKPIKYHRRQTLEDLKKLEQNIKNDKSSLNILQIKSACNEKKETKRRITPCLKNMVNIQNQKYLLSTATSRINRCKSKDVASRHQKLPSDLESIAPIKDFKRKRQEQQTQSEPLKMLLNFETTDTETLDLTNCKLTDTEIIYFVQRAQKIKKIKNLKLSSNLLTCSGLQKILPYLSYCTLINLSNNKLAQMTMDILLKKKQKIGQLKMLNLSNNKLNQRKIKQKIVEFKKMGIVVTL